MSDLQCPARILVLAAGGSALQQGGAPSRTPVLEHGCAVLVYDATTEEPTGAGTSAEELARTVGTGHRQASRTVSIDAVASRRPEAVEVLGEIADLHRGEAVVLLVDGPAGARLEVEVDADGIVVRDDPGEDLSPGGAR